MPVATEINKKLQSTEIIWKAGHPTEKKARKRDRMLTRRGHTHIASWILGVVDSSSLAASIWILNNPIRLTNIQKTITTPSNIQNGRLQVKLTHTPFGHSSTTLKSKISSHFSSQSLQRSKNNNFPHSNPTEAKYQQNQYLGQREETLPPWKKKKKKPWLRIRH